MSPFVYESIVYLCEGAVSCIFFLNLLSPKYNQICQFFLWCQIVMVLTLVTPSFSILTIAIIAVAELVFIMFLYNDKPIRKILMFLIKELIMLISSVISFLLYTNFLKKEASLLRSCTSDNCTYCLIYLLIFSIIISMGFQFIKKVRGVEFPWVIGTQLVIGVGEGASVLAVAACYSGVINSKESWLIVIATVCMVTANISIGALAPYLLKHVSMTNNIDYGKELSSMEYKYYEISVENDKKIHEIRHDISNHIQTIYSLLKNGENQKGLDLVDELKKRYAMVDQIVYCKNPVVNIILSNKRQEAEKQGIETHIRVKDDLDNIPVSDFDLSTIICNLIDNAVRGCICSEQSSPRLSVDILCKNHYLVIRILNSCKISMNIENTDRIETTKSNSQTHGFGMPIVAGIAKRYRGDFVVSAQNGIFTATVVMSIKGE